MIKKSRNPAGIRRLLVFLGLTFAHLSQQVGWSRFLVVLFSIPKKLQSEGRLVKIVIPLAIEVKKQHD